MKVTETIEINMPMRILGVRASPNARVPTMIAVMGSKTPSTEALVAPMFLLAIARVAVETMVGSMARPMRLSHEPAPLRPESMSIPEHKLLIRKTIDPTSRA